MTAGARHPFLDAPGPIAFAHRGHADGVAENSAEAIDAAVSLGYRYVETDIQATRDGVPVLFHDETTDRYGGLWLPGDTGRAPVTDATLIVKPAPAEAQRAEDLAATAASSTPEVPSDTNPSPSRMAPTPQAAAALSPPPATTGTRSMPQASAASWPSCCSAPAPSPAA